jgi:hypothetical protein
MRTFIPSLCLAALLAACGPDPATPAWVGSWSASAPQGSATMALTGTADRIVGQGVWSGEAVLPQWQSFSVEGAPPTVTFRFENGSTWQLTLAQPDRDHLVLAGPYVTLPFARQR